jgi:hypothetical protein
LALFALLLAVLQWKFFELRFNDYSRMTSKRFKQITVTGSLFLLLIALTGIQSNGFQQAWANLRTGFMEESVVTIFLRNRIEQNIFVADSRCSITYDSFSDYDRELVEYCKNLYGPATLIIGDSHGVVIYDIIRKLNIPVFVINWSRPASRPSSGIEGQYQDVLSYLEIYPNTASKVLFVQSGSYLLEDELGKVDSNEIFRSSTRSKPAIEEIDLTLRYLQQLANLVNVVWIGPYVQSRVNINNPSNWYSSKSISKVAVSKFIELDLYLKNVLEKSRVSYISTIETLRFPGDRIVVGNCIAWRDEDHFSECGRILLASSEYSFFSSILE